MITTTTKQIMIQPDVAPEFSPGGITLPDSMRDSICTGTIKAAQLGQEEVLGLRAWWKPGTGTKMTIGGEEFVFVHVEDELLAVDVPDEAQAG